LPKSARPSKSNKFFASQNGLVFRPVFLFARITSKDGAPKKRFPGLLFTDLQLSAIMKPIKAKHIVWSFHAKRSRRAARFGSGTAISVKDRRRVRRQIFFNERRRRKGFFPAYRARGWRAALLSNHFLDMVRCAVDAAKEADMEMCCNDEYPYHSGEGGGEVLSNRITARISCTPTALKAARLFGAAAVLGRRFIRQSVSRKGRRGGLGHTHRSDRRHRHHLSARYLPGAAPV
jgi:hypothetical protein